MNKNKKLSKDFVKFLEQALSEYIAVFNTIEGMRNIDRIYSILYHKDMEMGICGYVHDREINPVHGTKVLGYIHPDIWLQSYVSTATNPYYGYVMGSASVMKKALATRINWMQFMLDLNKIEP